MLGIFIRTCIHRPAVLVRRECKAAFGAKLGKPMLQAAKQVLMQVVVDETTSAC